MSRNRLHQSKLNAFIEYMEFNDWERVDTKGAYEVARLIHSEFVPVIIHKKASAKEHLTVHGEGEKWVSAFIRDTKTASRDQWKADCVELAGAAIKAYEQYWFTCDHGNECDCPICEAMEMAFQQALAVLERVKGDE
jgi:hypothetical protein